RMEPKEVVATLTQAIHKPMNTNALVYLAKSLSAASARLKPKEAAQLCGPAAAALIQTMSKNNTNPFFPWGQVAEGLSPVLGRLEPKEAAQLCGPAAATLIQTM